MTGGVCLSTHYWVFNPYEGEVRLLKASLYDLRVFSISSHQASFLVIIHESRI